MLPIKNRLVPDAQQSSLIEQNARCPLSFVRRPLLSNKKRDYIVTTGETQKEALRACKTTDYGQLTTDA